MNTHKNILLAFIMLVVIAVSISFILFFSKSISNELSVPKRVYKIGILNGFDYIAWNMDGFIEGMAELGYIEGKNVNYEIRSTVIDLEEYRNAVRELVAADVDLIFVFPTEASLEAKQIAALENGIPVIFSNANFEGVDLFDSIAEPGNNLTGVRYPGPDVCVKGFDVMLKILPDAKVMLSPYDPTYPIIPSQLEIMDKWSKETGVEIVKMPVTSPPELEEELEALKKSGKRIDAMVLLIDPVSGATPYVNVWGKYAEENNIPSGGTLVLKEDGYNYETIYGVDINGFESGKSAAGLADKILRGADPGKIPVPTAEQYIAINYRKAQEMGIEIDEGLLSVADRIVR